MNTKTRITISLSNAIKEWYKAESEEMGVSVSSYMVMVLAQYKENKESKRIMSDFNQLIAQGQKENSMLSGDELKEIISFMKEEKNN